MTNSTIARTKRALVWLTACLVLAPLAPVGHGAPASADAACDDALADANAALAAAPNVSPFDALLIVNAAGPACGFDVFENATTEVPPPEDVGTSLCPLSGGLGSTTLFIQINGIKHGFRDMATGVMAQGYIETEGPLLGMRASGQTGHVRVGPVVIPALDGARADVLCGQAEGEICVKVWIFEKCADAGVGMACSGTGDAFILNRGPVSVYGHGRLSSAAPCKPVSLKIPFTGGVNLLDG